MRTVSNNVYEFSELSKKAQAHAIETIRQSDFLDIAWSESEIEAYKEACQLFGISIDKVLFTGFSSQGDGACFEGDYEYEKGGLKSLKDNYPEWKELHEIAEELQKLQKNNSYGIVASVKHSGHYCHENETVFDIAKINHKTGERDEYNIESFENDLKDYFKDIMRMIYKDLEKEYCYLNSDESIKNFIENNKVEFYENGNLFEKLKLA